MNVAHPIKHAESSARKFGGVASDYVSIHQWMDESKIHLGDFRHRCLRHSTDGVFTAERIFGITIKNSSGADIPVRYIAEGHIKEDLGYVPSAFEWLSQIRPQRWMYGQPLSREEGKLNDPRGQSDRDEKQCATAEHWRAVTHLYSDFAEIWRTNDSGQLQSLVAQLPIDHRGDSDAQCARARLIALAPEQSCALGSAPIPPRCTDAVSGEEREAMLVEWLKREYIPWYEARPLEQSIEQSLSSAG